MAIINMITAIKKVHVSDVVFVKIGTFFHVYGKDAYIISFLSDYKIKKVENIPSCGFPSNSINKIVAKLEEKKINYIIVDRRNNYDVDEKCDYKNLNSYNKIYEIARPIVSTRVRIENINNYLLNNINNKNINIKELLKNIEVMINERRKIQGN